MRVVSAGVAGPDVDALSAMQGLLAVLALPAMQALQALLRLSAERGGDDWIPAVEA